MLEVEVKAWADLEAARARLEALGRRPAKDVVKEDAYFCAPEADPRTCDARRDRIVRLRIEGPSTELGTSGAVVTAKRREVVNGVETNEEIELAVEPAERFLALLAYMGYRRFITKRKESRAYRWSPEIQVELNRIEGLGDFVEIEALVPDGSDVEKVRGEVRSILRQLGVDEARIEARPYMDLLRERARP